MNRRHALLGVMILASAHAAPSAGQPLRTEVIAAGFRPAEELAAVLRPIVAPPGSVSAFNGQLVIRASPAELDEIRVLLATLDRPPATLMIRVRHDLDEEIRRDLASAFARVDTGNVRLRAGQAPSGGGLIISHSGSDGTVGARVESSARRESGRDEQSIRVLEGREAFIRGGISVPTPERRVIIGAATVRVEESTAYRSAETGFHVRPRLTGDDRVVLDIRPQRQRLQAGGAVSTREVATSVIAPLGRWVRIGGGTSDESASRASIGARAGETASERYDVYVRVERLAD